VDAAEPSVAHHEYVVADAGLADDGSDKRVEIVVHGGFRAERRQRAGNVPTEIAA